MSNQTIITLPSFHPHPAQQQILQKRKRFNVIKCGRRFGKSQMSQELAVDRLCDHGQRVAYFAPTYKDGYEWWNEIKSNIHELILTKDEQVKQIRTITGGLLDMWSMEDPNSGRGRKYHRVIIDECEKAPKFKEAWQQTIRATLSDYQGDAWFLSTPKFGKTFFKEISRNDTKFDNWTSWKFTTYDNPHIKPEEVDDAKSQLDELTFRCEFLADDVDLVANPFCYSFIESKHVKPLEYNPYNYTRISFDFNVDPITAVVSQYDNERGIINIVREFRLANSNMYELCDQINATYPNATFLVTGDASGKARSALTVGNINYYTIAEQKLRLNGEQLKVPSVNPAISDSRVLCNSILQNFPIFIDPSCTYLIDDLKYVEVTDEGDINKKQDKHRSHLLDAFRYTLNTWHKDFLNLRVLEDIPEEVEVRYIN